MYYINLPALKNEDWIMKFKTHLAVIILMILGMAIMANQVTQSLTTNQASDETEQNDTSSTQNSEEEICFVQSNLAINSFTPITLNQEFYQIREIILDEVADPQHSQDNVGLSEGGNFKTLFRQVINPNAP